MIEDSESFGTRQRSQQRHKDQTFIVAPIPRAFHDGPNNSRAALFGKAARQTPKRIIQLWICGVGHFQPVKSVGVFLDWVRGWLNLLPIGVPDRPFKVIQLPDKSLVGYRRSAASCGRTRRLGSSQPTKRPPITSSAQFTYNHLSEFDHLSPLIKEEPVTHVPKRTQWLPSLRDECVLAPNRWCRSCLAQPPAIKLCCLRHPESRMKRPGAPPIRCIPKWRFLLALPRGALQRRGLCQRHYSL